MKISAVLALAALGMRHCCTVAAAPHPQHDFSRSKGINAGTGIDTGAGTQLPRPTRQIGGGLSLREKALMAALAAGGVFHVVRVRGKSRVIKEKDSQLESAQRTTDEKLQANWRAYKQALEASNKDRSFRSSSHALHPLMVEDKLLMKCILEKLGLAEVVFDEHRVGIYDFDDASGTCAERRGYLPSMQQAFYLTSTGDYWVVIHPDLYTPHLEADGGPVLQQTRTRPEEMEESGGRTLAGSLTPANIAKYGAERLLRWRPGGMAPAAAARNGAWRNGKMVAPRLAGR